MGLIQDVVGALGETSDTAPVPVVGAGVGALAVSSLLITFEAGLHAAQLRRGGTLLVPGVGQHGMHGGAVGEAHGLHGQHAASCTALMRRQQWDDPPWGRP